MASITIPALATIIMAALKPSLNTAPDTYQLYVAYIMSAVQMNFTNDPTILIKSGTQVLRLTFLLKDQGINPYYLSNDTRRQCADHRRVERNIVLL